MLKIPENVQSLIKASNQINNHRKAVEELIYNALDAGATSIAIRIDIQENTIQVIDNGCGVYSIDFKSIGQRHMTSGFIDLSTLKSASNRYGFRGQSLANIVNVSKSVKIISRHEKSEETWMKLFEYGKEKQIKICNTRASNGTTVEVHGFLYNLSIQKKSKDTLNDLQSIKTLLQHLSLVHSNISLSLRDDSKNEIIYKIHKNRDIYQTLSTLYSIEKEDYQELIVEKNEYKVTAFIGKSDKETGRQHFIFLNGKFIANTSKLHTIVNNNLSKHFKLGGMKNQKARNINKDEESQLFQRNIPFYVIFIKCPCTDYNLSNSSKQSVLEFKDWNPVNKLLDKLIKFYNGDMSLKEVNKVDNIKESEKAKGSDTREQVKKIMEKILGDHSKKPGISHMHNGVKGKQIKRKTKKAIQKTTPKVINHKEDNEVDLAISNNRRLKCKNITDNCTVNKSLLKKGLRQIIQDNESRKPVTKTYSKLNIAKCCLGTSIGKSYNSKFKKLSNNNELKKLRPQKKQLLLGKEINGTDKMCTKRELKKKTTKIMKKQGKKYNLIRKFEMATDSVRKRCDELEKQTKDLLNKKYEVFLNQYLQSGNFTKKNINVSIRKQIDEIVIHDFKPKLHKNKLMNDNNVRDNVKKKTFQSNYDLVETILKTQQDSIVEKEIPEETPKSAAMMVQLQPSKLPPNCGSYEPDTNIGLDKNSTEPVVTFQSHHYNAPRKVNTEFNGHRKTNTDFQLRNNNIQNNSMRPRAFITKQSKDNFNSQRHVFKKKTGHSKGFRSNLKRLFDQTSKLIRLKNNILGKTRESSYNTIKFTENDYKVAGNKDISQLKESTRNPSQNIQETLTKSIQYNYSVHKNNPLNRVANSKDVTHITDSTKNHFRNIGQTWTQSLNYNYNIHRNVPVSINTNTYTVSNVDNNDYTGNYDNCNLYDTHNIENSNKITNGNKSNDININFDDNCSNNRNFILISNSPEYDQNVQNMLDPVNVCETILHSQEILNNEFEVTFDNNQNISSKNRVHHSDPQKTYDDSLYGSYTYLNEQNKEPTEDEHQKLNKKGFDENVLEQVSHHFSEPNNVEINNAKIVDESMNQSPILTSKLQNKLQNSTVLNLSQVKADSNIKDSNLGDFNLKNRLCFVPKGMSPIFENCHTKSVCEYNLSEDYYEDEMYKNFVDNVRNNADIFEPKIQTANKHTTSAIDKINSKLNKDNYSLKFDGHSLKDAKILGQIDKKFIAAIMKGGYKMEAVSNFLILFDQHAVHERIRLEKNLSEYLIKNQWKPVKIDEVTLKMTNDDILYLHNYKDKLEQLGLQWTVLNANNVSIGAIPEAILGKNPRQAERVIQAVKNLIAEEINILKIQGGCVSLYPKSIMDLVFSEACRYAIKFGDKLSKSQCVELLQTLSDCKTPFQCAHGRPVMAVIMDIKQNIYDYKVNFNNIKKWRNRKQ